MANVNQLL